MDVQSRARRSPLRWSRLTPSTMSRPRSRTRRVRAPSSPDVPPPPPPPPLVASHHHSPTTTHTEGQPKRLVGSERCTCLTPLPPSRRHPPRSAASDLRRQAAGGRSHSCGLQHPEGVDAPPGAASAWRWQEAQEEDLHQAQEDQAQAQEGQARSAQVLQGRRQRQDHPPAVRTSPDVES